MPLPNFRLRRLAVIAVAAAVAIGLGTGPAAADDTPIPDDMSNAEFFDVQCAVPPNHNPAITKQIYRIGVARGVTAKVMLSMFEAGWVESHMNNLNCGDRDSLGVFQQRPSQGWCNPASLCMDINHATNKYLDQAIPNDRNNPGYTAGQLAQSVQRSAYPERYDQAEAKARAMIAEAKRASGLPGADGERVSDFSGDGAADVLGVDATGKFLYYPNNNYRLSSPKQIGHNWGSFKHVVSADWSGDGAADVIAVDSGGKLWYYPNNGYTLYNSTPRQLGHGWGTFKHVMAADWSGDGKADVLGVDAAGDLWYYAHNGNSLSTPVKLGHGWGTFKHVMAADWSGDGKADVLGVDAAGDLWYYPHNGNSLSKPVKLGHGWGTFKQVWSSDFSKDGKADVLGVDASGNLWYYPHSGSGFGPRVKLGHGWGTFKHVM
ncbi:VCBS repeat protein [Stackebrandtia endophytica]|uniref:VCBS repeat protein n=1 Tax=Stackebrandtia endophytica TaxID=1496996 RepID=A0A543AY61_9ACTN|nr:FG-GAP-like repeat-containing protein [Stackebrandtia endophytica]TQL77503.1 VCBS repeat protein [Stackebrandtia endophytica]